MLLSLCLPAPLLRSVGHPALSEQGSNWGQGAAVPVVAHSRWSAVPAFLISAHVRIAVITVIHFGLGIHFENLDFPLRRDYHFSV